MTDYTRLSIAELESEFAAIGREAATVFAPLDSRQINWRPDALQWSVAQCLDHLLSIDRQMFDAMEAAMDPTRPRSLVQRVPLLPALIGKMMIRSLGPTVTRKLSAPGGVVPSASALDPDIVRRFIEHQAENAERVRALGARDPDRVIMRSPFAPVGYSVLDACRLVAAHERRHVGQARRVIERIEFPRR